MVPGFERDLEVEVEVAMEMEMEMEMEWNGMSAASRRPHVHRLNEWSRARGAPPPRPTGPRRNSRLSAGHDCRLAGQQRGLWPESGRADEIDGALTAHLLRGPIP